MRSLLPVVFAALTALVVAGCTQIRTTVIENYANGGRKKEYTYYLDRHGNAVLQGRMLSYPPPGGPIGEATLSEYDHGKLVKGPDRVAITP